MRKPITLASINAAARDMSALPRANACGLRMAEIARILARPRHFGSRRNRHYPGIVARVKLRTGWLALALERRRVVARYEAANAYISGIVAGAI